MNIAEQKQQILQIQQRSYHSPLHTQLQECLRSRTLAIVQATLESALVEELRAEIAWWQTVVPRRSGYFTRSLDTQFGRIEHLRVPKLRSLNQQRHCSILQCYQRLLPGFLDWAAYLYILGLSIRDLQEALFLLMGQVLSRSAINRVTLRAEQRVEQYRNEPIINTPPVNMVDRVRVSIQSPQPEPQPWLDQSGHCRVDCLHAKEFVLLIAITIWEDGTHQVLHYEVAEGEEETSWQRFWEHLFVRGLERHLVRLVVSDGCNGLPTVLREYLPWSKQQRCITHKVRGTERFMHWGGMELVDEQGHSCNELTAKRLRVRQFQSDAYAIWDAEDRSQAKQRLEALKSKWEGLEPQATHTLAWGFKTTLNFYDLAVLLHKRVRTTNIVERLFREFRNRADEVGAFPNQSSCLTMFYLVVEREHSRHKRKLSMKDNG